MEIELVNTDKVSKFSKINNIRTYKNGDPCCGILEKFVLGLIKEVAETSNDYYERKEEYNNLVEDLLQSAYNDGFNSGVRETKKENGNEKRTSVNNWEADKVYPKGSIKD